MNSADNSGPFLRAPREIRDSIYRFLLSTKHTKKYEEEPEIAGFFEARQVYNEASNVFYMENLFIRVNSGGGRCTPSSFGAYQGWHFPRSSRLPILSWSTLVLACKRHVMELNLGSALRSESHDMDSHFIFACDDLPIFSRILVVIEADGHSLPSMELSIIIGDELGTVGGQRHGPNTPTDGNPKELLTAATKNAAASHKLANETSGIVDESTVPICEYMKGDSSTLINRIKEAKSRWSQRRIYVDNRRVRSLLEPLRLLYDIENLYIDAPISEQYWLEIFTTLSGPQPSVHVLFTVVYTALDEAVALYDADDMAFAILKLKGVMDTMNDVCEHCGDEDLSTVVMTGQYTGLTYWDAHDKMRCLIWNKLARASLNFSEDPQHVRMAWNLTQRIIEECRCYQLGCKDAEFEHGNVYSLETVVWEALDQLGEYNDVPRSHALRYVVESLKKAVTQEPGNAMLEKELQRRVKEKQEAEMIEDVRKMERDEGKMLSAHLTRRGRQQLS